MNDTIVLLTIMLAFLTLSGCEQKPKFAEGESIWTLPAEDETAEPDESNAPELPEDDGPKPDAEDVPVVEDRPINDNGPDSIPGLSEMKTSELEFSEALPPLEVGTVDTSSKPAKAESANDELKQLLQQGNYQEAISRIKDAIVDSPDRPELYFLLATVYQRVGNDHAALPHLSRVIRDVPNNQKALRERASLYLKLKKFEKSYDDLSAILELSPRSADALVQRAIVSMNARNYEQATSDVDVAIEIDETIPEAYYARALILMREGMFEHAKAAIELAEKHGLSENLLQGLRTYYERSAK